MLSKIGKSEKLVYTVGAACIALCITYVAITSIIQKENNSKIEESVRSVIDSSNSIEPATASAPSIRKNEEVTTEDVIDTIEKLKTANETLKYETDTLKRIQEEKDREIEKLNNMLQDKDNKIKEMSKAVIYDVNNIGSPSGATYTHMRRALKGTTMEDLADAFVDAEKAYSVNAFFLAGLVANESSWATSPRAINQNNLTGHDVPSDSSEGTYFVSKADCIRQTTEEIRNNYLNEDGEYYNGVSLEAVNKKYSQIAKDVPNPDWYAVINSVASSLRDKANDTTYIQ